MIDHGGPGTSFVESLIGIDDHNEGRQTTWRGPGAVMRPAQDATYLDSISSRERGMPGLSWPGRALGI